MDLKFCKVIRFLRNIFYVSVCSFIYIILANINLPRTDINAIVFIVNGFSIQNCCLKMAGHVPRLKKASSGVCLISTASYVT